MSSMDDVDFGPLAVLTGTWAGDKGMDMAPEPDGTEENPYYETITFEPVGDVENAEDQVLAVLEYKQVVMRKSNDEVFHHQIGYWIWDARDKVIMHSLQIPRAVGILAGGTHAGTPDAEGNIVLEVSAAMDDPDWGIVQSPYMQQNARTTAFRHTITAGANTLAYSQTTMLQIYGRTFEHTDQNELTRQ